MLKKPVATIGLIFLFVAAVSAIGQNLLTETQIRDYDRPMPTRGMTMELVESTYGAPAGKRSPVGDPPITRWEYQQFIVYFEYKRVIHSVSKRPLN
ncbi:MAG: hypothetical protein OER80_01325 [Gammaproteobacteria bacterium]|nr:hypothetical protein [Gammaproteobacteria bacterium]MDH3767318.1 hypothetical protein [Gammaproteobacteria bacterium]